MLGEEISESELGARGLTGDRAYALVDAADGKVSSAKNPRKWGKLFECRAASVGEGAVRITLADGTVVASSRPDCDAVLSRALGRAVRLSSTAPAGPALEEYWPDIDGLAHREAVTDESIALGSPAGTFFDFAPLHLVTSATLAHLGELYPQGRFDTRRFRPNLVVEVPAGSGFVENGWIGRTLAIGDRVRLTVVGPCPRCVMTTLPQGDLPQDPGILRTAVRHNRVEAGGQVFDAVVGVYATALAGGTVRRGDPVRLE
jgi:hypothetical protein